MVAVGHQTLLGNVGAAPTLVCKVSLSTSTILTFSDEGLAEFALSVSQGGGHATTKSNRALSSIRFRRRIIQNLTAEKKTSF